MKAVVRIETIPNESAVSEVFKKGDYCDSYRISLPTEKSAEQIAAELFELPRWVKELFKLRNAIVKPFGLKRDKDASASQKAFFNVIAQDENEIVMGENDKHLNFRVSILIDRSSSFIYLTTLVHFNNMLGRMYFLPVKPFHKLILKSLLKRQLKREKVIIPCT